MTSQTKRGIIEFFQMIYVPVVFLMILYRDRISGFIGIPRWLMIGPALLMIFILSMSVILNSIIEIIKHTIKQINKKNLIVVLIILLDIHIIVLAQLICKEKNIFQLIDIPMYDMVLVTITMMHITQKEEKIKRGLELLSLVLTIIAIYGWIECFQRGIGTHLTAELGNPQLTGVLFLIACWLPTFSHNRIVAVGNKLFFAVTTVFTMERSVWLGMVISAFVFCVIKKKELLRGVIKKNVMIPSSILAIIFLISPLKQYFWNRIKNVYTVLERFRAWDYSLKSYVENYSITEKLFGKGLDIADDMANMSGIGISAVDNQYISILLELGLVGIIAIALWHLKGISNIKNPKEVVWRSGIITVAMISPFVFYDPLIRRIITVILVMVSAILAGESLLRESKEKQ